MRKTVVIAALAAIMALALAGCGGSSASSASASASSSAASSEAASSTSSAAADKFDGSSFVDTGDGEMILRTAGGTSENGNVPQAAVKKGTTFMQIDIEYHGGNGAVCKVYVDGIDNMPMNAAENIQSTLTLQGDALDAGVHTVEMVAMDGDEPVIYKKAQYEIVN